jgi:hypothetical protein
MPELSEEDRRYNLESAILWVLSSFGGEQLLADNPAMPRLVGQLADQFDALALGGLFLPGKCDILRPDGTHRYYSTHCRHGDHNACSATSVAGVDAEEPRILHAIERKPAQCKHCGAPCCCEECRENGKH